MKRVALCVGVNRYQDAGINSLDYAEADATEVYAFLKRSAGYAEVRHLAGSDADQVLDEARALVAVLEPGDLFVFFFAGHGYEFQGRHLLLCPKARLSRLQYFHHTVPVDLLKQETAQPGVHRVFMLDACRSELLKERGASSGMRGAPELRELAAAPAAQEAGAFTLLCACDEGQQAREVAELRQGLFSRALLEELETALQGEIELRLDGRWESALAERMNRLAGRFGPPTLQRPWIQHSGTPPILMPGKIARGDKARDSIISRVETRLHKCPLCGRRNLEEDTFECQQCGRDYLCNEHYRARRRCCEECEDRLQAGERERPAQERAQAEAREEERKREEAERPRKYLITATKEHPWENSLGMRFVPVSNTRVLFSIWETRVRDYAAHAKAQAGGDTDWQTPGFEQGPAHPVAGVYWDDAQSFCRWLTQKERRARIIGKNQRYRLPTDEEWSWAVGLPKETGTTPQEKDGKIQDHYPWGSQWPPPKGAGNYGPSLKVDEYKHTSPVGSFDPNAHGLYDMGGNVWEWCEDWYARDQKSHVLRGGSWFEHVPGLLLSSRRNTPGYRVNVVGFRVVLAGSPVP